MKILLLASTLGLTLLANTAVAAVSSEENSVWRNASASTVVTAETNVNSNDWKRTEFNLVEKSEKESQAPQGWRKIRF